MYFTAPVYAQRLYAMNEGLYKIHAITKTKGIRQGNPRPLYDMLVQCLPSPSPAKPSLVRQKPSDGEEEAVRRTSRELLADDPNAGRMPDISPVPSPLDRTAGSRPYSPYGRFREPGYDASNLPQRAFSRDKQQPWQQRHADMINAYKPLAAGRMAALVM